MKHHDLSAQHVKLSYTAMLDVAAIAMHGARTNVERHLHVIQRANRENYTERIGLISEAAYLTECAKDLELATETWVALKEIQFRTTVEITNLPDGVKMSV